jgi:hypothetical protein
VAVADYIAAEGSSISAKWALSTSGGLDVQKIQLFSNPPACSTPFSATFEVAAGTNYYTFASVTSSGGVLAFKVASHRAGESGGVSAWSGCSPTIKMAPATVPAASNLHWAGGAGTTTSQIITAVWDRAPSPEIETQKIQFYYDAGSATSCTGAADGPLVDLRSAFDNTYWIYRPATGYFSFKITTVDRGGSTSTSGCSSVLQRSL